MQAPWLPPEWDLFTTSGLRLLDAEISRQALAIGFLNDFYLIMIGALISVPLVFLLSRGKEAKADGVAAE